MPSKSEAHFALLNAPSVREITARRLRTLAEFETKLDEQWAELAALPIRERLAGAVELHRLWKVWRDRENPRSEKELADAFAAAKALYWSLRDIEHIAGMAFNTVGQILARHRRTPPRS